MNIYLQTRGVSHDYTFVGKDPLEHWWTQAIYQDATSFEQSSLILERDASGQWRCFISGIPSVRRDAMNRKIRYTMTLSGGEADQALLLRVLGHVLEAFKSNPASIGPVTQLLDEAIGVHVDEWLGDVGRKEQAAEAVAGLEAKFAELAPSAGNNVIDALKKVLQGDANSPKRAALLNFIPNAEDPSALALRDSLTPAQGEILILPSPLVGGSMKDLFRLAPPAAASASSSHAQGAGYERRQGPSSDVKLRNTLILLLVLLILVGGVGYLLLGGSSRP